MACMVCWPRNTQFSWLILFIKWVSHFDWGSFPTPIKHAELGILAEAKYLHHITMCMLSAVQVYVQAHMHVSLCLRVCVFGSLCVRLSNWVMEERQTECLMHYILVLFYKFIFSISTCSHICIWKMQISVHYYYYYRHTSNCYLYGVFDGHNGSRVADFAAQRMPAELLLGQLQNKTTDAEIHEVLRQVCLNLTVANLSACFLI